MPQGVLALMFCATRPFLFLMYKENNTKNTSAFDSKSNFLRIELSSHCLWNKGRFAPLKKASCPCYAGKTSTQMEKK